jgi:malonate transporter
LCVITRVLPEPAPGEHQAGAVHEVHRFLLGEIETGGHGGQKRKGRQGGQSGESYRGPWRRAKGFQVAGTIAPVLAILFVTFPFFALVLAGYIAARQRMLPLEAIAGLNGFVLFFALPCMLYRFGATTPIAQLLDAGVFFTWLLCALVIVAFTVTISLNARIGWNDGAFGALVAAFPNTGFMGVPLLVALLGPRAAGPIIVTIMVDMVITTSLCIALSRLDSADEHGVAHAAQNALKGMLVNPLPWSILLGALASLFSFELPGPVLKTVGLLADAASPVALFTIGAVLARSQMRAALHDHPAVPLIDYLPVAAIKLLLHPLLVLLVGATAIGAWVHRWTGLRSR